MRLVTFASDPGPEAGVLLDGEVVPVSTLARRERSVRELLESLDAEALRALGERADAQVKRLPRDGVRLLAPAPRSALVREVRQLADRLWRDDRDSRRAPESRR
jgi:hypothetical protein